MLGPTAQALLTDQEGRPVGFGSHDRAWGTYLHGLFDADAFRRWWLNSLRARKGLAPLESSCLGLEQSLDRLADAVRSSLNMGAVYALLGL